MKLEVLHVSGCPNLPPLLERLAEVTDLPVSTRVIDNDADAGRFGMTGSPTLLIDGTDPFATAGGCECGMACRLYRDETGRIVPAPSVEQLRDALTAASRPGVASDVLSVWRTRALPLDPIEKAVHRAILRAFAGTGRPPAVADLAPVVAGSARSTDDVLNALHDGDAIRLDRDGQIAIAYPFSAAPTRHRVRIDDEVEAFAMCAIDALGIAAMLDCDTRIESVDVTTGQPVSVKMAADHSSWEPAEAVVFIGADAGGGPSADCCCDYLNFFTDRAAAVAWTRSHAAVPGQILDQVEAEELGARLFRPLLAK